MEVKRGQVARSIAGHDKGCFQVVLETAGPWALVCDGKRRPLRRPKRKNLKHLAMTATVLGEEPLRTDRQIRAALRPFSMQAEKT